MVKKTKMTLEKIAGLMTEEFGNVNQRINSVEKLAKIAADGFGNLNEKVDALQTDMTEVKRDVGEIKETLGAHGKAIDKDAVTLINHEGRIKKLEVVR